ncbi:MAG TPA: hypothetical protein DCE36_19440, partial [Pseudomonas sp.]|nr:hypothetical protein [Pseudomonas sp.]
MQIPAIRTEQKTANIALDHMNHFGGRREGGNAGFDPDIDVHIDTFIVLLHGHPQVQQALGMHADDGLAGGLTQARATLLDLIAQHMRAMGEPFGRYRKLDPGLQRVTFELMAGNHLAVQYQLNSTG